MILLIKFIFVFVGVFTGLCAVAYSLCLLYWNRFEVREIVLTYLAKFKKV